MVDSPTNRDAKARIPDLRGLREFSESTDREAPVAFVGREEQIGALKRDLETRFRQWQGWEGPGFPSAWEGATWLFQGAPGAGKTALLRQLKSLKARVPVGDGAVSGDVRVGACLPEEGDLKDPESLKRKIARAFFPEDEKDKELAGRESSRKGGRWSFSIGPVHFGVSAGKSQDKPSMVWEDVAEEIKRNRRMHTCVLLLVDEAQALGDRARESLMWLHEGTHGLPIVPVFGGLAWTKDRLGELGISRLSGGRVHILEALSEDECREAVRAFFRKFRVAGVAEEGEKWEGLIARRSQGWPQHLHVGLQALARGLVKEEVDGDLKQTGGKAVLQDEAERRKRYYQDRLGSAFLKSKRYLAAAAVACLDEFPEGATRSRMAGAVQKISDRAGGAGAHNDLALPKGMDAAGFVDGMMKSGILHEDGDGYLSVPIPSFRDFLIERYPAPDRGAALGTGNSPSSAS